MAIVSGPEWTARTSRSSLGRTCERAWYMAVWMSYNDGVSGLVRRCGVVTEERTILTVCTHTEYSRK